MDEHQLGMSPFFHGFLPRNKAEIILKAIGQQEGAFLLRLFEKGNYNKVVVSVTYKRKPTHHLLSRSRPGK